MKKILLFAILFSLVFGGLFAQGAEESAGQVKTIKLAVGDPIGSSVGVTAKVASENNGS